MTQSNLPDSGIESQEVEAELAEALENAVNVEESAGDVVEDVAAVLIADLQRLQADYANYRKRVERDRTLSHEIAIASALIEMLPVLDGLDRAQEHGELSGGFKSIADQITAITNRVGIIKYGEAPSPFDPNIHEALMHETSSQVTETTVTKVLQPGYKYKDRILRAARVLVTDPE